jgi:hypothetical protein
MKPVCPQCRRVFECDASRYNRAVRLLAPLYCGKACAGLARRTPKPDDETRRLLKAAYDSEYRERNAEKRRAQKAAWFKRTYDPAKAAVERKARMPRHVEYCRRPEYRAWKAEYDRAYKARLHFGEWADAALLLGDLEREINERATRYEVYQANGTLNKAQTRRRAL